MHRYVSWALFGLTMLASAAWPQAAMMAAVPADKAVAALEMQWLQGYKTNNVDLIAPLIADKYVVTDEDGSVSNRTQALADAKSRKWSSAEYEGPPQVTVFGDTAIATGGFKGKGVDGSGKPFDVHTRWTDTWVKMPGGKWQCVASQDSPVK